MMTARPTQHNLRDGCLDPRRGHNCLYVWCSRVPRINMLLFRSAWVAPARLHTGLPFLSCKNRRVMSASAVRRTEYSGTALTHSKAR